MAGAKTKAKTETNKTENTAKEAFSFVGAEVGDNVRTAAETGLRHARDGFDRIKETAEETSELFEASLDNAAKGFSSLNRKMIEIARANVDASFDFANELVAVRSPADFFEVNAAFARKQFAALTGQGRDVAELASGFARDVAAPVGESVNKALRQIIAAR